MASHAMCARNWNGTKRAFDVRTLARAIAGSLVHGANMLVRRVKSGNVKGRNGNSANRPSFPGPTF